ncbi:hypothetical protein PV327_004122 [Microctonus hyperodae]|uniref:Replication protein A subunit n=1 Tax=Microctonus hyperodae TaxID=165561 RepID=A0AA39KM73_MICHY|nr:hypothetical protein PV327_004122 [Microctonus hyperodae]
MIPLTTGALTDIIRGVVVTKPILQVLGTKRLTSTDSERYRLLLSDGVTITSFTMLATQLNYMVKNNELTENSIVEIGRYALSNANNAGKPRKIMVVLDIDVKVPGREVPGKIGNPVHIDKASSNTTPTDNAAGTANAVETTQGITRTTAESSSAGMKKRLNESINSGVEIVTTPIAALSPYQNRWVVKVRVANKSDIRHWSNSRGEGKLFNMTLVDESGEIRCTGFTDQVDRFYDMIEIGKVYYISRGQLKTANKAFNNTNNEYELTLSGDSEIAPCHDDADDIPGVTFSFVAIRDIENYQKNDIIDVLAIVKSAEEVQLLTARATGRELRKRDLTLIDMSDSSITLTLWGSQAEKFDSSNNPVIAVKGARIGEFNNGKNLSLTGSSVLQVDPDIPDAHRLRGWFNTVGKSQEMKSLSKVGGGLNADWMLLNEANEMSLGSHDNSQLFMCKATVSMIRGERALYKACPTESCKKKVIDHENDMYRCEKCDREYPNFRYRLLTNMNITDWSGNQWVTAFGEEGEKIIGMSAQELGELSENQPDDYNDKFSTVAFNSYIFKIRTRVETYNDEARLKGTIQACEILNYKMFNKHLVQELKKMANVHNIN